MKRSLRNSFGVKNNSLAVVCCSLSVILWGCCLVTWLGIDSQNIFVTKAFATEVAAPAPTAANAAAPISPFQFILSTVQFFLIGFFIYFWLAIRPGQLREEERRKFLKDLKKNDDVMTSGGIFGKVALIKDDSVSIDVGGGVKIRVHLEHIQMLPPSVVASDNSVGGLRLQAPAQKTSE